MSKHRRQREVAGAAMQTGTVQKAAVAGKPARAGWRRLPVWGWALIFLLPLILSEIMFYQAGRGLNMVLFPIVWAGFWVALWYRSAR